ncbi:MAG: DNA-methyltransferase [Longimicrobiales bacterium]
MRSLPPESVHCCVTSPPYWNLRDYGVAGQVGLEETVEDYVESLVEAFRQVRRVLRPDGTLWLNLGDSYAGARSFGSSTVSRRRDRSEVPRSDVRVSGLKPKDLVGVPWRVAFALRADGWWLRSDVVWSKPNPMPESVLDRPTRAHEYLFLLSKSERYYYDPDAVSEPSRTDESERYPEKARVTGRGEQGTAAARGRDRDKSGGFPPRNVPGAEGPRRNLRSVWTVTTRPYPEAHFAVYPPELVEPCVLAGTSAAGACPECLAPLERVVDVTPMEIARSDRGERVGVNGRRQASGNMRSAGRRRHVDWRPTCECFGEADDPVPCVVLDPFAGSGTTGMVATGHGREAVLIDLNPDYAELMSRRIGPLLVDAGDGP